MKFFIVLCMMIWLVSCNKDPSPTSTSTQSGTEEQWYAVMTTRSWAIHENEFIQNSSGTHINVTPLPQSSKHTENSANVLGTGSELF